jgi:hypothetical protein
VCGKLAWLSLVVFFALALFLVPATSWAEGLDPLSSQPFASVLENSPVDSSTIEQKLLQLPPEFWQKWNEYSSALSTLAMSLEEFLDQVEAFGISFEELPSFIQHLIDTYETSEAAHLREREAAAAEIYQAEQARDRWRAVSLTAAGAAVGGLAAGPVGAAVGAAAGLILALIL